MRNNAIIAAVLSIVLCTTMSISAEDPAVSITADPTGRVVGSRRDRAYIRVIIRVEPNRDNRNLIFESDSEDGEYSRKDIQLDGENSPRIFEVSEPQYYGRGGFQLPAGHYKLRAIVERSTGKNPTALVEVNIITSEELGEGQ